jgi:Na+/proline symporter
MFIAAPGRVYGDGLTQYLADIGILGVVVAAYLFVQRP